MKPSQIDLVIVIYVNYNDFLKFVNFSLLTKSDCTLKNDKDEDFIQRLLNEKVRLCTYQWYTAYAVALPSIPVEISAIPSPNQCLFRNNSE